MKNTIRIFILLLLITNAGFGQDGPAVKLFFAAMEKEDYDKIDKYLASVIDINQVIYKQKYAPRGHNGKYNSLDSRTPLVKALELKKPELVKFLIERGANVNQEIPYEHFEYCKTCGNGEWLRHKKSHRPVSWAIDWGNTEIIDLLIENGASYDQELELIKSKSSIPLIKYFSEKRNFPVEFTSQDLEDLFKKRYNHPNDAFVSYLLDKGVVPTPITINRLVKRKSKKSKELVKKALDAGAEVNAYEREGKYSMCALCQAVLVCDVEMTKMLVEDYSANVNAICSFYAGGATVMSVVNPIQIANDKYVGKCRGRNDEMTELLIFAKASQAKKGNAGASNVVSTASEDQVLNALVGTRWSGAHTYKIYPNTPSQIIKSDPIGIEFISNEGKVEAVVSRSNSAGDPYQGTRSSIRCSLRFDGDQTIYLDHVEWLKKDKNAHKKEANFILTYKEDAGTMSGEIVKRTGSNHSMTFYVKRKKSKSKKKEEKKKK